MQLLSSKELATLARSEKDARKKMRLLAISHFIDGKNRSEIAIILKISRRSVNHWVRNYLSQGIDALNTGKSTGGHGRGF